MRSITTRARIALLAVLAALVGSLALAAPAQAATTTTWAAPVCAPAVYAAPKAGEATAGITFTVCAQPGKSVATLGGFTDYWVRGVVNVTNKTAAPITLSWGEDVSVSKDTTGICTPDSGHVAAVWASVTIPANTTTTLTTASARSSFGTYDAAHDLCSNPRSNPTGNAYVYASIDRGDVDAGGYPIRAIGSGGPLAYSAA